MDRIALIENVVKRTNLDEFELDLVLQHFIVQMKKLLHQNEKISISGFGNFELKQLVDNQINSVIVDFENEMEFPVKSDSLIDEPQNNEIKIIHIDSDKSENFIKLQEENQNNDLTFSPAEQTISESLENVDESSDELDLSVGSELFEALIDEKNNQKDDIPNESDKQIISKIIQQKEEPINPYDHFFISEDEYKAKQENIIFGNKTSIEQNEEIIAGNISDNPNSLNNVETFDTQKNTEEIVDLKISDEKSDSEEIIPEVINKQSEIVDKIPVELNDENQGINNKNLNSKESENLIIFEKKLSDKSKGENEGLKSYETVEEDKSLIFEQDDDFYEKHEHLSEEKKELDSTDQLKNADKNQVKINQDYIEKTEDTEETKPLKEPEMATKTMNEEEPKFILGEEIKPPTSDQQGTGGAKRPSPITDKKPPKKDKSSKTLWFILGILIFGLLVVGTYYLLVKPDKGLDTDNALTSGGKKKDIPPVIIQDQTTNRVDTIRQNTTEEQPLMTEEEQKKENEKLAEQNKKLEGEISLEEPPTDTKNENKKDEKKPETDKKPDEQQKPDNTKKKNIIIMDEDFVNSDKNKKPVEKKFDKPVEKQVEKPIEKPVEKKIEKPLKKSEKIPPSENITKKNTSSENVTKKVSKSKNLKSKKIAKKKQKSLKNKEKYTKSESSYSESGGVSIVVGSHQNYNSAKAEAQRLKNRGYKAYVEEREVGGTKSYRVKVGKYNDEQSAEKDYFKIKSAGKKDAFIDLK